VVPDVLKYAAMNVLMGNWDDYWFLRNNYYLYHDPSLARIRFIPYDYDNSFSIDWFDVDWTAVNPYSFLTIEETQGNDPGSRPLMERIMENTQYRNLYTHILEFYRDNITELNTFEDRLDDLKDMITPWAEQDSFRTLDYGFTIPDFHQSYTPSTYSNQHVKKGLKQFINERHTSLNNQLVYEPAAPIIYDLKYEPLIPGPEDSIYVSVAAFSDVGLDSLTIAYHPGVLTVVLSYPMRFSPKSNPESIEDSDRWVGVIPPMGDMGHGRFQVGAMDLNGQHMLYPRSDFVYLQVPEVSTIPLRINEFMADNEANHADPSGEFDDWLEIYNSGPADLYLSGMYLTDDSTNLTKWMFPFGGIALETGGHLLLWCDEDQEQPGLHTNFKLSRSGEFIALVDIDGETIIDALNFGAQDEDVSYGRYPDGGSEWAYFENPTPGASNSTSHIHEISTLPDAYSLNNFPNPFNASTVIRYRVPKTGEMELSVMDIQGCQVQNLIQNSQMRGEYSILWEGRDDAGNPQSAGVYFVRLTQAGHTLTHKILLLK